MRYALVALIFLIAAIANASAAIEDMDLTDNVLVLYNENTLDAKGIAEYYANARGISSEQICPIKLPPGQFATAEQLLGARKTIVTALPIVVNYYGQNIWVAFATIAIQTTILTALAFKQWKARKVMGWMKRLEKT